MNLQTFTASTMHECLAKVKQTLGTNAVILHTRSYSKREWLSIRKREFVEITAAKGMAPSMNARRGAPPGAGPMNQQVSQFRGALAAAGHPGTFEPSAARTVAMAGAGVSAATARAPGRDLLESPAVGRIFNDKVARDVEELKTLVGGLVDTMRKKDAPNVPEELFDYYLKLVQSQVSDELASEIVQEMRKQLRPEHLQNETFVKEKIGEYIEKLIPTCGPIVRKKSVGPHVIALIGPTGVGKTTTIAKLAANLKLRDRRSVGLITIDTYRIAAIDQLRRYAEILDAPLRVTNTAEELREAIHAMRDCEFVLIDTAGRSPRDTMKINELKNFLDAAAPDEIHLVLSSTASEECVELAIERFGEVHFEKVIFTKLDEAAHVGVVLNAVKKLNKSLSYITTGQDVPNDIEEGHGRRLAKLILGEPL